MGEQHEEPDQNELAGDEQSRRPDVRRLRVILGRRRSIRGLVHLTCSLR